MRRSLVSVAVLVFLVSASAGCSTLLPKKLDMGGLETELASQLNEQLDTSGITVTCPDDVKAESGGEFECTGTLTTGDTLAIHVTQTDDDGHVNWAIVDAATPSPSA
jgi:uncharacterized protein DUF4333